MEKARNYLVTGLLVLGLVLGATIATISSAGGVDMTGLWNLEVKSPSGSGTPKFDLKQEGDKLSGTYVGAFGKSPVEGTVTGNKFEITFKSAGNTIVYTGVVKGNEMSGTVDLGDYGKGTFTGKRK